ncbi:hypothetical protein M9H77_11364 [Catharanthus roseus]|uniref:Uncharacterized protein n=1 Tax=Catharanthus roseus TaxID=4058 RepID=A0ACC0BEA9_CATRO|nr:hypothetical protein M9H77_11364 [Catharanthus roseus]
MKKANLVFIPSPRIGHLISAVEMAKILLDQDERLSVTLVIIKLPFDTKISSYAKSLCESSTQRMKFIEFDQDQSSTLNHQLFTLNFLFETIESHKGKIKDVLVDISNSETYELVGVIIDMFCGSILDVVNEFEVPSYVFYTSSAAFLGLVFHFQRLRDYFHEDITKYKHKTIDFAIPTYLNPVPMKVMPGIIFEKEEGSELFLDQAKRYGETNGIIINTFLEFEFLAVQALSKDPNIPRVYTVGPVLNLKSEAKKEFELILKWLDIQPKASVIFLCFGSFGSFSAKQVKEIAHALEHSGHRFLWSLRKPPPEPKLRILEDYKNLEEVLPEGFLKRTTETGKVIGWAPQVQVLSHPAVGGFVSHCGWNSILESIWFGVPIATWPIYAEQHVNAFEIVKDLNIAVEIEMDYKKDFKMKTSEVLSADLLEESIRRLMDPENEIRKRVKEIQRKTRLALKEGGSSYSSIRYFIDNMFCCSMLDVVNEFKLVPSYVFYTSSAAALGLVFYFQRLRDDFHEDVITKYKDKIIDFVIPTYVNPVPMKVLPGIMFKEEESKLFLDLAKRYRETKGIIVNTFLELESHAVQALSEDLNIPPVYTVGPVVNLKRKVKNEYELIMKWLDTQPKTSVVFLCFGSFGSFLVEQVIEIAHALENSGHRFLWSLRRSPSEDKLEVPGDYESLEEILPKGFLKRTSEMGKVIGWAPQVEVLSHSAIGGFISHCGWNSILESVWFGVPMATWPIYAEQQVNAFQMVKDLEMAVEIKIDYKRDFGMKTSEILSRDLLKERIRHLMDSENEITSKVKEIQKKSRFALKEGGSSYSSIRSFIDNVFSSNS